MNFNKLFLIAVTAFTVTTGLAQARPHMCACVHTAPVVYTPMVIAQPVRPVVYRRCLMPVYRRPVIRPHVSFGFGFNSFGFGITV